MKCRFDLSVQSVTQACPTLWDPMDYSTPGFPVHHQLLELAQTHVHRVGDAIQPSHPVIPFSSCLQSFPASGSFPVSWFFAWHDQSIRASASASVVPVSLGLIHLGWTGLISCSPRDSQESCSIPQFKNINSSALIFLCGPTLTSIHGYCKNHSFD